jgi:hypothetical protein
MAKTNVSDFYELRTALVTMRGVAQDALDFFDRQGIAARKGKARFASNGHGAAAPDGKHLTMKEAAKIFKVSDSCVRLWVKAGKLPQPTFERRDDSKPRNRTQVLLKDDVLAYAAKLKAVE